MHIPNGFLDPKVSSGTAFAAAAVIGYCMAKVGQALAHAFPEAVMAGTGNIVSNVTDKSKKIVLRLADNHIMRMTAIGSLVFSAQMFNFSVANGTSGHFLGGVLAAVALGPFSGSIVIGMIMAVQCLFFADGGIAVLGANILNMAVIGSLAAYYIYYVINRSIKGRVGFALGVLLASFCSVFFASLACSIELGASGTIPFETVIPAMSWVHARIGIAEALLTFAALNALMSSNFDLEGRVDDEK